MREVSVERAQTAPSAGWRDAHHCCGPRLARTRQPPCSKAVPDRFSCQIARTAAAALLQSSPGILRVRIRISVRIRVRVRVGVRVRVVAGHYALFAAGILVQQRPFPTSLKFRWTASASAMRVAATPWCVECNSAWTNASAVTDGGSGARST